MTWQQKNAPWGRNKYGAKSVITGGRRYDSGGEAKYAAHLQTLKLAKEIKDWTPQVQYDLKVNGKKICGYRIDFRVEHHDGSIELIEYKGFATSEWKLKWKLAEALLHTLEPEKDVRLTLVMHR